MKFGDNLNIGYFGLTTLKHSDIRTHLDLAIVEALESGDLAKLGMKWWYKYHNSCNAGDSPWKKKVQVITYFVSLCFL
jgi:hypothetical protein